MKVRLGFGVLLLVIGAVGAQAPRAPLHSADISVCANCGASMRAGGDGNTPGAGQGSWSPISIPQGNGAN